MTDPKLPTPDDASVTRDEQVDQVERDAEAMERYDRAIPLPDKEGEQDEGVGEITGLVP